MLLKVHSLWNAPTQSFWKRVSTTSQVKIYDFFLSNPVLRPSMKLSALITLLIKIFILCICFRYWYSFLPLMGEISVQLCILSGFQVKQQVFSTYCHFVDRSYSIHPAPIIDNQKCLKIGRWICRILITFFGANALNVRLLFYHSSTNLSSLRLYPTPFSSHAFTTEKPTPIVILSEIPDTEIHHVSNQRHSH